MTTSRLAQLSKEELESLVSSSYTYKEVLRKAGYTTFGGKNNDTLKYYINLYNISCDHFTTNMINTTKRNEENVFCKNSTVTQTVLRRWFIRKQYVKYECSKCGISEWNNQELALQLDHIDGDNSNNEISNLRWLCPNCHSQTENFAGKNVKLKNEANNKYSKKKYCKCGKEITLYSKQCRGCFCKSRRKVKRPTKEQLYNDLKETNFLQVGKKYGVSDNTIRKWCKNYNLPIKATDYQ